MIVLQHCSTSKPILNVALSSSMGYRMSLRLLWVNSLSLPCGTRYARMVHAVLLVPQIVPLPLVTSHRHTYREGKGGRGLKRRNHPPTRRVPCCRYSWAEHASLAGLLATISPTRGATQKCGSPYPQLKGPHRSVGVRIPNSRGHAKAWESKKKRKESGRQNCLTCLVPI